MFGSIISIEASDMLTSSTSLFLKRYEAAARSPGQRALHRLPAVSSLRPCLWVSRSWSKSSRRRRSWAATTGGSTACRELSRAFPSSLRVERLKGIEKESQAEWKEAEKIYQKILQSKPGAVCGLDELAKSCRTRWRTSG